jgi:hypothetical protein
MFPVDNPWAVDAAFKEFVDRCEKTLLEVFGKIGSDGVDFRAWLYEVSETTAQRVEMLHSEPLYVAADYLGVTVSDGVETAYKKLSVAEHWNQRGMP